MTAAPVAIGQVIDGRFRVDSLLGAGTMGMVFKATHLGLNTSVAIKVMVAAGGRLDERRARFLREGRVAASLKSPHVASVMDTGTLDSGDLYLVMEFLEGRDLAAVIGERGPLPIEEAVTYAVQACHAIAEAHQEGIVHRDIKPANLFLTKDLVGLPCVKVVDFGIAKRDDGPALTQTGAALGSPLYMSPEAMRGLREIDARSDIWSLGATLYQMLSAAVPFAGSTVPEVATRVVLEPPTPLGEHRPDLPPQLIAVVMQCFEKDPSRRWPSVAAFAAALAPFGPPNLLRQIEKLSAAQRSDVVPSRPTTELAKPTDSALDRAASLERPVEARTAGLVATAPTLAAAEPRGRGRGTLIAAGLAVLALLGGAGGYLGLRAIGQAEPAPSATGPIVLVAPSAPAPEPIATPDPVAEPAPTASASVAAPEAPTAKPTARPGPNKPAPRPAPPPPIPKPRKDPYKQ